MHGPSPRLRPLPVHLHIPRHACSPRDACRAGDHTNHPRYVDWLDEAISRWLARQGRDPVQLVPVAEQVRYLSAARAGDALTVEGARVGTVAGAGVFNLSVRRADADALPTTICEATLIRAQLDDPRAYA